MGTSKSLGTEPQQMAEEKKSIKNLLKKPFRALFQKDKRKRESLKQNKDANVSQNTNEPIPPNPIQIAVLLEKFNKLELQKKEEKKHAEDEKEEEDEFKNFSYIVVKEEDEKRSTRIDSHSSEDSGYADKCTVDSEDEKEDRNLIESLNNLKVDTDVKSNSKVEAEDKKEDKKKKKLQTVYISRGPIRNSAANFGRSLHPYGKENAENVYRQVSLNPFNQSLFKIKFFLFM